MLLLFKYVPVLVSILRMKTTSPPSFVLQLAGNIDEPKLVEEISIHLHLCSDSLFNKVRESETLYRCSMEYRDLFYQYPDIKNS